MKIKQNLCMTDRIVRLTLGVICIYIGFIDSSIIANNIASILIGVFGTINLFAFLTSFCPVYGLAGLSTLKSKAPPAE